MTKKHAEFFRSLDPYCNHHLSFDNKDSESNTDCNIIDLNSKSNNKKGLKYLKKEDLMIDYRFTPNNEFVNSELKPQILTNK